MEIGKYIINEIMQHLWWQGKITIFLGDEAGSECY